MVQGFYQRVPYRLDVSLCEEGQLCDEGERLWGKRLYAETVRLKPLKIWCICTKHQMVLHHNVVAYSFKTCLKKFSLSYGNSSSLY